MKAFFAALAGPIGPAAVATVVRVEGSAYRREGAKMLIPANGPAVGMISGGCLEADLQERVLTVLADGRPRLLTFDMRSGDDGLWGLNMGCNGLVEVLLEPLEPAFWVAAAGEWLAGRPCAVLTVVASPDVAGAPGVGTRLLLRQDGSTVGSPGSHALDGALWEAVPLLAARRSGRVACGPATLFVDVIHPAPVLWVVGAGGDAEPLVRMAAATGWRVRVVDRRAAYASPDRFPEAEAVLALESEDLAARAGAGAYAVFLHHHFDHDRDCLQAMLGTGARYLGVLGPLRRTRLLLGRDQIPPEVHAPVGLNLGGETPEEIALAIVAELQAVRYGRNHRKTDAEGDLFAKPCPDQAQQLP